MSLVRLQAVIDRSLAGASPLTRELFDEHMDAPALRDFINEVASATVATVGPNGRPHAALTLVACSNSGDVYIAVNPRSALSRNLKGSPFVALTVDASEHGLMAQGEAELVGLAPNLRATILPELDALMARGRWVPSDWDGAVYRLALERIFAR